MLHPTLFKHSSQDLDTELITFYNMLVVCGGGVRPTDNQAYPLSAAYDCLSNIFRTSLHIQWTSSSAL